MDETTPAQNQLPTNGGYEIYGRLMSKYARLSPQHQGLTEEEFAAAVADPNVAKTEVTKDGETAAIPQLAPVESNQWLNAGFYSKTFPEEYARGDVLNFVDIPDVEPGPEVQERLKKLAETEGVIVFDYPTDDPDYVDRVRDFLDRLGIEAAETETLGNQTYFAGQARIKRPVDPAAPKLSFAEAYEREIADGEYDTARVQDGASLQARVDPDQARHMQQFYDAAYQVLNDHPCRQGLDPDEFLEMATDREWVTKIVNSAGGEVQAICLLDNRLDELSWVNADYYRDHFPDKAATEEILWFPGVAASPDKRVAHNLQSMVDLMTELADKGNREWLVVFDCCDMNTGFLDAALNQMINATGRMSIDIQPIAVQRYCAIKTQPKQ